MAKDRERWIVFEHHPHYRVYIGKCPQRTKAGRWPARRHSYWLSPEDAKFLYPKRLLPKPGGGPVKLEFK